MLPGLVFLFPLKTQRPQAVHVLDDSRVAGVVSMVVSPAARRQNLLQCAFRSLSSVVQDWPDAGTNCRSSVQIRHASGGASEGGYWVPQAVQMKAVMRRGYTVSRCSG